MKKMLEPFRPTPILVEKEGGRLALEAVRPDSIGRVKAFVGNFGVLVRALLQELGCRGIDAEQRRRRAHTDKKPGEPGQQLTHSAPFP